MDKILYHDQSMDFILNKTIISRIVKITVILPEKIIFTLKLDKRFRICMYNSKVLVAMVFPVLSVSGFKSIGRWLQFDKDHTSIMAAADMLQI